MEQRSCHLLKPRGADIPLAAAPAEVDEGVERSPQLWKFRHIRKFDIAIADRVETSAILKKPRIGALLRNRSRHENSSFSLARNTLYQTARRSGSRGKQVKPDLDMRRDVERWNRTRASTLATSLLRIETEW